MLRSRLAALLLAALGMAGCAGDSTRSEGPLEPGGGEAAPNAEEMEGEQSPEAPDGQIEGEDENAVDG